MKFSIIIPIHNQEEFIADGLNSILNQFYSNYEIILVNDRSKDNSSKIIKNYMKEYKQLSLFHTKRTWGAGAAWNIGLNNAIGEYIIFLDSDDILENNYTLEQLIPFLEKKPDALMCGHRTKWWKKNKVISKKFIPNYFQRKFFHQIIIQNGSVCNFIWKKSLFKDNNITFPENTIFEDLNTKLMLLSNANNIEVCETLLYVYNIRQGKSITTTQTIKSLKIFYQKISYNFKLVKEGKIKKNHKNFLYVRALYDVPVTTLWILIRVIEYQIYRFFQK